MSSRYERVVLNDQSSSRVEVSAGVPQGSILGLLLFLMYINDLSYGLSSTTKHFADDTSLFSVVHDVTQSTNELNDDLEKNSNWVSTNGKCPSILINLNKPKKLHFLVKLRK